MSELRVLDEEVAGLFAALAEALLAVAVERAELLEDLVLDAEVEDVAFAADAVACR